MWVIHDTVVHYIFGIGYYLFTHSEFTNSTPKHVAFLLLAPFINPLIDVNYDTPK